MSELTPTAEMFAEVKAKLLANNQMLEGCYRMLDLALKSAEELREAQKLTAELGLDGAPAKTPADERARSWARKYKSSQERITALEKELIWRREEAEKKDAELARVQAQAAAMREASEAICKSLRRYSYSDYECYCREHEALERVLIDSDAGRGWVSPEEHARVVAERDALKSAAITALKAAGVE